MEITDWREVIDCVLLMHNCGFDNDDISKVLDVNMIYIYAILLGNCGTLGWERKEKLNVS